MRRLAYPILSALLAACVLLGAAAPARAFTVPVAASFSTAVPANRQSVIALQGSDAEGTSLVFATTSSPAHGALSSLNTATGYVVYTPTSGYVGSDSFNYTVTSGGETSAAGTVTLSVTTQKTTVTGTITDPGGGPRSGKVTFILTQQATTPAGLSPVGASVSAALNSSGAFTVQVYPSRSMSPAAYYQVWFNDSTGRGESLGVYDIPASTTAVTLSTTKLTDTNLAARYTFVSEAALKSAIGAGATQFSVGGDAAGDIYYRDSAGKLARLAAGAAGQTLEVVSGLPTWVDPDGGAGGLRTQAVGYWKLDESGGAAYQNSAGADVITPSGSFAGAGKVGSAPSFYDASSRYAAAPDSAALSASAGQPLYLAFWFYNELEPSANNPGIVSKRGGTLSEYQVYYNKGSHRLGFTVWNGATATEVFTANSSITTGVWHFVEAWHDPAAATINIRLDRGATASAAFAGNVNDSNSPFELGRAGSDYLSARVDELGLWKSLLNSQQSTALYNEASGSTWPFSSASSSSAGSTSAKTYTFDIKEDFGASGSETTTTTSGSTTAGATTVNVVSAASFQVGQGVLIYDAGAGTDDYVGEITAVAGGALTVTPATSRTVASGTTVQHDDCGAMQASLDASATGAKTFFPRGVYRCNRPVNGTTNAVLTYVMNGSGNAPYSPIWEGEFVTRTSENAPPWTGVVIDISRITSKTSSGTFPSWLNCRAYVSTIGGGGLANFNYAAPELRNFYIRAGPNSQISALNFNNCIDVTLENIQGDTNELFGSITEPTNSQSTFIILPGVNNHAQVKAEGVSVFGWYNCFQLSEHAKLDVICSKSKNVIVPTAGGHLNQGRVHYESVPSIIKTTGTLAQKATFFLTVTGERNEAAAGLWYGAQANKDIDIHTAGDVRGKINYFNTQPTLGANIQSTNTSGYLRFHNLYTGTDH
ncbi:MAG TPA: Ig-like domain-containing protein [Pyrinomonadaceae bacterium]|jgi:hypothetical protein